MTPTGPQPPDFAVLHNAVSAPRRIFDISTPYATPLQNLGGCGCSVGCWKGAPPALPKWFTAEPGIYAPVAISAPRGRCAVILPGRGVTVPDLFVDLPLTEPSRSHSCGGFLLTASFLAGVF